MTCAVYVLQIFFFWCVLRSGTGRVKFSCNACVPSLAERELTKACQEIRFNKINILKIFLKPNIDLKDNCRVAEGRLLICSLSPCCVMRARN